MVSGHMVNDIHLEVHDWYKAYHSLFINMALSYGYTQEEAGDIVSQFYLDLLEKPMEGITHPKAYLSTAFRRKLIDRHRAAKKEVVVTHAIAPEQYIEGSAQEKLEQIQANTELIKQLRNAYQKLPERCRKVIYLKFYKGLTTEQIAAQTGLTKRTVYNNLFEGVKLLRLSLNNSSPDVRISSLLLLLPFLVETIF